MSIRPIREAQNDPFGALEALEKVALIHVLIISLLLYGFAGSAGYFMDSLTGILIARALLGLATAGVMTGFITLIGDYYEGKELNKFMGYQSAALGIGGLSFVIVSGLLADISWRLPFLLHLLAFVILPGVLIHIKEPIIREEVANARTPDASNFKTTFPWRKMLLINGVSFFGMLTLFVFPVQLPFLLTSKLGVESSQIGLALGLQAPIAIVVGLMFGRIKARFSFRSIYAIIFLATGINLAITARLSL